MCDGEQEYKWSLRFTYSEELSPGQLNVICSHPNYKEIPYNEQFEINIYYRRKTEAFRALGRILGATVHPNPTGAVEGIVCFKEEAQFETMGLMVDCSRGGVLLVESVCFLLRACALMGFNMIQLYTEDTYEVEGEPFFGYLRGGYSQRELSTIDDYADDFGIEVIPCIQTLGHLGQILQWPRFSTLRDTGEVLLTRSEETLEFIEKMIKSASAPLRSKRIHIGMDEAHGLGEGRFKQIYGSQEGTRIFIEHLQKVNDICKRLGLQPMIWSDSMLFSLAANNNSLNGYYDYNVNPATDQVVETISKGMELVFWDYYHTNSTIYAHKIQQHRELGCYNPWVAGGNWTWNRFWCALPFTFESTQACLQAAKDKTIGVSNVISTIWGDEGNECDIYSALPGLVYFAQHCYSKDYQIDVDLVKRNFAGICGGDLDDFVFASKIDEPSLDDSEPRVNFPSNMSKWLLWEDPFYSFLSPQYSGYDLEQHYAIISDYLFKAIQKKNASPLNTRLQLPYLIANVLMLKCHLRERMIEAYRSGQRDVLYELVTTRLGKLREEVDRLWRYHRSIWMKTNKPFGWEVLELRYGGLRTRLTTMYERIMEYLDLKANGVSPDGTDFTEGIPEFEVDLTCVYEHSKTNVMLDYFRVSTPSRPG
ncbi:glycoside hydrolase [Basidiobolus meristosporus CBS 931.73]|uniref:beta-N-acetylhexosaminidase n=1 Tax=Basidiobolus meristosporus CBS 931.73 TaxID=1314790 RepID=A0A1Y1XZA4_9FUNG|nr:glycoside hydrolase [Basidiobolus meristosporus CBS 931.73]|eukprot:ORX91071.1 glycoside hydrolase [Basidiobolus meristosporus CBS 931.73]